MSVMQRAPPSDPPCFNELQTTNLDRHYENIFIQPENANAIIIGDQNFSYPKKENDR